MRIKLIALPTLIYTGYFAMINHYPNPISIARYTPNWFKGETAPQLAPSKQLLKDFKKGNLTEKEYPEVYKWNIKNKNITPKEIIQALPNKCTLICYETPDKFCHRHVLAQWIMQHTSVIIKEFEVNKTG